MRSVAKYSTLALVLTLPLAAWPEGRDGLTRRGGELFRQECAPCHGEDAVSGASGDIRGVSLATVKRAIRGAEQMPDMDLPEADLAAIAAWLSAIDN